MANYCSVGELARDFNVNPRRITALFYERALRDDLAPIVGGRRIIPESMIPVIKMALRRRGVEVREAVAVCREGTGDE